LKMFDRVAATQTMILRPTIAAAVLDDGAVLLDLNSKYFYSLNGSAWAIVQLFENGASAAEAQRQCTAWGAGDTAAAFIAQLMNFDLLESATADAVTLEPPAYQGPWIAPVIDRQAEPLERVIVSAFDPSIPLAE
jgi:hypothetical protein